MTLARAATSRRVNARAFAPQPISPTSAPASSWLGTGEVEDKRVSAGLLRQSRSNADSIRSLTATERADFAARTIAPLAPFSGTALPQLPRRIASFDVKASRR